MASEDSAEDLADRPLPVLPVHVHGVSDLDDRGKPVRRAMQPGPEEPDYGEELVDVRATRGEPHVLFEKRHKPLSDDLRRQDGVHEHLLVTRLRANTARAEVLLGHLEEPAAQPALIDEELRSRLEAERMRRVSHDRDGDAPLAFDNAG